jgi:hypothetical protein
MRRSKCRHVERRRDHDFAAVAHQVFPENGSDMPELLLSRLPVGPSRHCHPLAPSAGPE